MSKPPVLMAAPMPPDLESALNERFDLTCLWKQEHDFLPKRCDFRALVVNPHFLLTREILDRMPALEIVSTFSVGLDKIDLAACKERGIAVTYTPDVVTDETADVAMGLVLATMRRLCAADRFVRQGLWPIQRHFPLTHKVTGKRLGIVGLGRIGAAIARRAEGFSCKISYYSRSTKTGVPYTQYSSLVELAADSDILIVACALTKETFHLIDRTVMDALGSGGTLINIARGPVVDEAELVSALVEGRLGGAGLDVFESEPDVPRELLGMDNVVLLPHVGTATWETIKDMADLVVSNLEAHFAGQPLLTPVS